MRLKSKVLALEDAPCWNCSHCASTGKTYPTCHASKIVDGRLVHIYYPLGRGAFDFVRFIGCPSFEVRQDMPCYHSLNHNRRSERSCYANEDGFCRHEFRDYEDCQNGWLPHEYDKLHGEGAHQKEIEKIMREHEGAVV